MAEDIGKLVIDFEADINDFKMAISEVKGLMKDMNTEVRKSSADFGILAGVTAGAVNFGLGAMGNAISNVVSGVNDFMSVNPDFVQAQSDLNMTFMEFAEDVGPGATDLLKSFNNLLVELKDLGAFEALNTTLEITANLLDTVTENMTKFLDIDYPENVEKDETGKPTNVTMDDVVNQTEDNGIVAGAGSFLDYKLTNPESSGIFSLWADGVAEGIKKLIEEMLNGNGGMGAR